MISALLLFMHLVAGQPSGPHCRTRPGTYLRREHGLYFVNQCVKNMYNANPNQNICGPCGCSGCPLRVEGPSPTPNPTPRPTPQNIIRGSCPTTGASTRSFCGYGNGEVYLGPWSNSNRCETQCTKFLAGREGCCRWKTNKAHCWVTVGSAPKVKVQMHSSHGFTAVTCTPTKIVTPAPQKAGPTARPTTILIPETSRPTSKPTAPPTRRSRVKTPMPTTSPSMPPSRAPSMPPNMPPSMSPSMPPTAPPSVRSTTDTRVPSMSPSMPPTGPPSVRLTTDTRVPSMSPSMPPTGPPSVRSTTDTRIPTPMPTTSPIVNTARPTSMPTRPPTSMTNSRVPTPMPTTSPIVDSLRPTSMPTRPPTSMTNSRVPTPMPTTSPIVNTARPTSMPTRPPTSMPSRAPTSMPSRAGDQNMNGHCVGATVVHHPSCQLLSTEESCESAFDVECEWVSNTEDPTSAPTPKPTSKPKVKKVKFSRNRGCCEEGHSVLKVLEKSCNRKCCQTKCAKREGCTAIESTYKKVKGKKVWTCTLLDSKVKAKETNPECEANKGRKNKAYCDVKKNMS